MCKTAVSQKTDFLAQLGASVQGTVKPSEPLFQLYSHVPANADSFCIVITQCCIHELYLQGKAQQEATDLAKTFERRKCNHREPIPGDECLLSVTGASEFVIALEPILTATDRRQKQTQICNRYTVATFAPKTTRHPRRPYCACQPLRHDSRAAK